MPPKGPNMAPHGPQALQDGRPWPKMAPQIAQDGFNIAPERPQMAPSRFPDGSGRGRNEPQAT